MIKDKCSFCEVESERVEGKLTEGWGKAYGYINGQHFDITFCPLHRKEAEEKLDLIFKV